MRFMVLACDYDGTLATHGQVDEATIRSLERCLDSNRKLVMVTGRELPELMEVFPRLNLFEWVVAENGGLLYRPATREEKPLGPPPSPEFVTLLDERGVQPLSLGRVIVATWQPHETTVLQTIRDLRLEMQVIFNKGAVMILPSGINKATGLSAALHEMGLSFHNAVAIGDAENDHALLASCEAGVAVANAVATLKEHADWVTAETHGAGVQELVERLVSDDLAELEPKLTRHDILLGQDQTEREFRLHPFRGNVLIAGASGSGKSTTASAIIEQLFDHGYQVCIIDPEGDYDGLENVLSIGAPHQPPTLEAILKLLESPRQSICVNLLGLPFQDRPAFFHSLWTRLDDLRARTARPHWIVIGEAHHVWPTNWEPAKLTAPHQLDRTVFITLDPHLLPIAALSKVDLVLATGKTADQTLQSFATSLGLLYPRVRGELEQSSVVAWEVGSTDAALLVKVTPARRQLRRHVRKYAEGELEPDRSFYFRGPQGKLNLRAQNLSVFLQMAEGVDDETWRHHLRAGDVSRWFREAIKDPQLADQAATVEAERSLTEAESRNRIRGFVEARYTLPISPATPASTRMVSSAEWGNPDSR
jgi:hydroxymethylpyrimidine pyrophosphatase-like HAD family hydrolase